MNRSASSKNEHSGDGDTNANFVDDMFNDQAVPQYKKKEFLNEEEEKKYKRMTQRKGKKKLMFYPEDKYKGYWDLFMTLVLLVTCINTPINIAFSTSTASAITDDLFSFVVDLLFLLDIFVIFNSA